MHPPHIPQRGTQNRYIKPALPGIVLMGHPMGLRAINEEAASQLKRLLKDYLPSV